MTLPPRRDFLTRLYGYGNALRREINYIGISAPNWQLLYSNLPSDFLLNADVFSSFPARANKKKNHESHCLRAHLASGDKGGAVLGVMCEKKRRNNVVEKKIF